MVFNDMSSLVTICWDCWKLFGGLECNKPLAQGLRNMFECGNFMARVIVLKDYAE